MTVAMTSAQIFCIHYSEHRQQIAEATERARRVSRDQTDAELMEWGKTHHKTYAPSTKGGTQL